MLRRYLSICNWLRNDDGQGLTEYAMIMVLVVIAVMASLALVGNTVDDLYSTIVSQVGNPF